MTVPRDLELADIVGAWTLHSAVVTDAVGTVSHPYGQQPQGVLLYTPDGWMSATISSVGDGPTTGGVTYAGPVKVAGAVITHTVAVGAEPFTPGTVHPRHAELRADGTRLTLTTPPGQVVPTSIRLTWQRTVSGD